MADIKARLLFRKGTAAQWAAANPVLLNGEPAWETDTGKFKIGNGSTAYASLPFYDLNENVQPAITGAATTITNENLTPSRALVSDENGKVAESSVPASRLDHFVPSGGIIMWSGSVAAVPSGWTLCNGANGTPDLRNRFIVGAGGAYGVGATGGADTVALTAAQMPAHSHNVNINTNAAGDHRHHIMNQDQQGNFGGWVNNFLARKNPFGGSENYTLNGTNTEPSVGLTSQSGSHAHNVNGNTASAGSGNAHENRPPYYALAYIMKL
jgi:microcystin-dependent protein